MLLGLLLALPALWWADGLPHAALLEKAGIRIVAAAPEAAESWKARGFTVIRLTEAERQACETAVAPGLVRQTDSAGATAMPWLDANGWRFRRRPEKRYCYEALPKGKLPLAAAEAHAYGVSAILKVEGRTPDEVELRGLGAMLRFLEANPVAAAPARANIALVDDGSEMLGEVMNLLARRNLLFDPLQQAKPGYDLVVKVGTEEYPEEEAIEPYRFALKVRQKLGNRRWVRIYGSEAVLAHLTAEGGRSRLHLLNYAGRPVEGLRLRVAGQYRKWEARGYPQGAMTTLDDETGSQSVEFTIPRLQAYVIVDLWE